MPISWPVGFTLTGKVFAPVTASKKRSEYMATPSRFAMFTEALDLLLARDGADVLKGYDGLFFLYAGRRVQTGLVRTYALAFLAGVVAILWYVAARS